MIERFLLDRQQHRERSVAFGGEIDLGQGAGIDKADDRAL